MKTALLLALCGLAGVTITPAVQLPHATDAGPEFKHAAHCILRILKSTPEIDNIELGVSDASGWSHPFLQYRVAPDSNGYRATIRFEATKDFNGGDSKPFFVARLGGLFGPDQSGPPDYGAGKMANRFEKKCNAHAMVLFI